MITLFLATGAVGITFKVKNARSHVRISQLILISGCTTAQMNGTDAMGVGSCNLSQVSSRTARQGKDKLQRQPDVAFGRQ